MSKKNRQFAVLGLGMFGRSIVTTLSKNGCDVLACDIDEAVVQEMSEFATHVVQVDVTDEAALRSLGLGNFDVAIIGIRDNMQASVMATLISKELGVKYILAKAQNEQHKKILEKIGADKVMLAEWEMGQRTAIRLISEHIIDYINLSDEYHITEIMPFESWIGLSLKDANVRATTGLNIVAIKRNDEMIIAPIPNEVIEKTDVLVALASSEFLERLPENTKSH